MDLISSTVLPVSATASKLAFLYSFILFDCCGAHVNVCVSVCQCVCVLVVLCCGVCVRACVCVSVCGGGEGGTIRPMDTKTRIKIK